MSKKYKGKACAYCGRERVSTSADHVVAREFFLIQDRANLPKVPACERCNHEKSLLEQYALTVLPIGSRHVDAETYSRQNVPRRLRKNPRIDAGLSLEHSGIWERSSGSIMVPLYSVAITTSTLKKLFVFITRGLYAYHWGMPLHPKWYPDVAIIKPEAESESFRAIFNKMGRRRSVKGNLGRETFVYWGTKSLSLCWWSLWQFTLFGGLRFGSSHLPGDSFTKLSAVTRPDISLGPFTREEAGLVPESPVE